MIYFVRGEGTDYVKIGCAKDPKVRIKLIVPCAPFPCALIRTAPGHRRHERALHSFFSGNHIYGEWFTFSQSMLVCEIDQIADKIFPITVSAREVELWLSRTGTSGSELNSVFGSTKNLTEKIFRKEASEKNEEMVLSYIRTFPSGVPAPAWQNTVEYRHKLAVIFGSAP